MSFTLTLAQTALFKSKLDVAALLKQFGPAFFIGLPGPYGAFVPLPQGTGAMPEGLFIYGRSGPLGRGFLLTQEKGRSAFNITTPLPTTHHDLTDMFAFAGVFAGFLGAKQFELPDGGTLPRAALGTLYPDVAMQSNAEIQALASGPDAAVVSGVRFPLWLPQTLCRRVLSVPKGNCEIYFSSYLAEKQQRDCAWLSPRFSQDETGAVTGRYTLAGDTLSIIPKQPFVPYGPPPFGGAAVGAWLLDITLGGAAQGTVPYGALLDYIEERDVTDFDEKHCLLRPLSQRRLRELLQHAAEGL